VLSEEKKRRASLTELQAIGQKGFARKSDVGTFLSILLSAGLLSFVGNSAVTVYHK
jgi:hypothetical protein